MENFLSWANQHSDLLALLLFLLFGLFMVIDGLIGGRTDSKRKKEVKKLLDDLYGREPEGKWGDDWKVEDKMKKDREIFISKDFKQKRKY